MSGSSGGSFGRSLAKSYAKVCGSGPSGESGRPRTSSAITRQVEENKVNVLPIDFTQVPGVTSSGSTTNPDPGTTATSDTTDQYVPIAAACLTSRRESADTREESQSIPATPVSVRQDNSDQVSINTVSTDVQSCISVEVAKKNMAENLTDPDFVRDYFSYVVEHPATSAVAETIDEQALSLKTDEEFSKAQERVEDNFTRVCDLPLKLILTPLSRGGFLTNTFSRLLEMEFGPLHAALQVGDVILEWNDTSLVVPHFCEHDDPLLKANIQHLTEWVDYTDQHRETMREVTEKLDYQGQIELIFRTTAEKSRLIDALVEVIVKYNRFYYYNLIDRNCQHFVLDALKALGVDKPIQFTGGLGEYYKSLKSGKSKSVPVKYKNHAELNMYVKSRKTNDKLDSMPQADLEFLLAQYFQFHLQDRSQYKNDPVALENWKCTERECLMPELEKRIMLKNLKIHSFRTD